MAIHPTPPQSLADRLETIDPTDFLYVLRDTAARAADMLRDEIGRAQLVLGKLELLADQSEKVAMLASASDLFPTHSATIPPEAGLVPAVPVSDAMQRAVDWGGGPKPDEFPYQPIV